MRSILVFCGSNTGDHSIYQTAAYELGKTLAEKSIRLIYGAGNVGLMGILADAALAHGGMVMGIIPDFLRDKEVCHEGLTELIIVKSMAERKLIMAKQCDGVITLPGGYGTLDELFEMLTLAQLSQMNLPVGILNIHGFFDPLLNQLDLMHREKFLKTAHRQLLIAAEDIHTLLLKMSTFKMEEPVGKWEGRD